MNNFGPYLVRIVFFLASVSLIVFSAFAPVFGADILVIGCIALAMNFIHIRF